MAWPPRQRQLEARNAYFYLQQFAPAFIPVFRVNSPAVTSNRLPQLGEARSSTSARHGARKRCHEPVDCFVARNTPLIVLSLPQPKILASFSPRLEFYSEPD